MFHSLIFLSIPIFHYNMSLSLINVLLLTVAFAHVVPQRGLDLEEAELDKLYPKCWVDVSTMQGKAILHNVPGRCKVKVGKWKNVFAHTLGIAGGCGKKPSFWGVFFCLNCDVFQQLLANLTSPEIEEHNGVDCGVIVGCGVRGPEGLDGYCIGANEKCWGSAGVFVL